MHPLNILLKFIKKVNHMNNIEICNAEVISGPIRVRLNPEIKPGNIVNIIDKNTELIIYDQKDNWVKHNKGGWSMIKDDNEEFIKFNLDNIIIPPKFIKLEEQGAVLYRMSFKWNNDHWEFENIHPEIDFDDDDNIVGNSLAKAYFSSLTTNAAKAISKAGGSEKDFKNGSTLPVYLDGAKATAIKNNDRWVIKISSSVLSIRFNNYDKYFGVVTVDEDNAFREFKDKEDKDVADYVDLVNSFFGTGDDLDALQSNNSNIDIKQFITEICCIFGMPYQFDEISDPRPAYNDTFKTRSSVYGRKYLEKMVSKMPLLYITPGTPKFLPSGNKDNIMQIMTDMLTGDVDAALSTLSNLLDDGSFVDQKYYSLEFNYTEYYKYVNTACSMLHTFLNLHESDNPTVRKFGSGYHWADYQNSSMQYLGGGHCLGFYMDSETQSSESFSNATGESSLAQAINSAASMSNEIQFLLGSVSGADGLMTKTKNFIDGALNQFMDKWQDTLGDTVSARLNDAFKAVTKGGKMIFPKIWQDSSFSRSYSCSFKLSTPDADDFSWFMNIGVPLIHLVCLTAPRQLTTNSFQSPFLVRAYSKGFMNVDMGVISSLSITKGDRCKWNLNGLPMEIDIGLEIEDLYSIMSINKSDDMNLSDYLKNTAMMDYLANLCGININKPDFWRHLDMIVDFKMGKDSKLNLSRDVKNLFLNMGQSVDNFVAGIYGN